MLTVAARQGFLADSLGHSAAFTGIAKTSVALEEQDLLYPGNKQTLSITLGAAM